ncbi:MAG: amidohydrolase family protein [Anaerolineae bacterium]
MVLDGHIHIGEGEPDPENLIQRMRAAGVEGGLLFSQAPASFGGTLKTASPQARLENLMAWTADHPTLYPLYWIDPLETDTLHQVKLAVERGVAGFKVICDHFYPADVRALKTFRAIAEAGMPILFHSGILWDGKPSSHFSRPVNFEALLDVPGIRLALAHISWPWIDECIALYGKLAAAVERGSDVEIAMFIDTTPGTPPIYRREALTKLFTVGYDVAHNVFFGSDCRANDYGSEYAEGWITRDRAILTELGVESEVVEDVFSGNVKRFLGKA